jgi:hypothetical protein
MQNAGVVGFGDIRLDAETRRRGGRRGEKERNSKAENTETAEA